MVSAFEASHFANSSEMRFGTPWSYPGAHPEMPDTSRGTPPPASGVARSVSLLRLGSPTRHRGRFSLKRRVALVRGHPPAEIPDGYERRKPRLPGSRARIAPAYTDREKSG